MQLLVERGQVGDYPNVYAFDTNFFTKLLEGGHVVVARWTKKVSRLMLLNRA